VEIFAEVSDREAAWPRYCLERYFGFPEISMSATYVAVMGWACD
jgi:hypothetical protein